MTAGSLWSTDPLGQHTSLDPCTTRIDEGLVWEGAAGHVCVDPRYFWGPCRPKFSTWKFRITLAPLSIFFEPEGNHTVDVSCAFDVSAMEFKLSNSPLLCVWTILLVIWYKTSTSIFRGICGSKLLGLYSWQFPFSEGAYKISQSLSFPSIRCLPVSISMVNAKSKPKWDCIHVIQDFWGVAGVFCHWSCKWDSSEDHSVARNQRITKILYRHLMKKMQESNWAPSRETPKINNSYDFHYFYENSWQHREN